MHVTLYSALYLHVCFNSVHMHSGGNCILRSTTTFISFHWLQLDELEVVDSYALLLFLAGMVVDYHTRRSRRSIKIKKKCNNCPAKLNCRDNNARAKVEVSI